MSKIVCEFVKGVMKAQRQIIKKHIKAHQWYRNIPNKEEAVTDFIKEFGWLMREMYCGHCCPHRDKCALSVEHEDADTFETIKKQLIKRHINDHKWYKHIPCENEATEDFIDRFYWLIQEMFCRHRCPYRFGCDSINDDDGPNII